MADGFGEDMTQAMEDADIDVEEVANKTTPETKESYRNNVEGAEGAQEAVQQITRNSSEAEDVANDANRAANPDILNQTQQALANKGAPEVVQDMTASNPDYPPNKEFVKKFAEQDKKIEDLEKQVKEGIKDPTAFDSIKKKAPTLVIAGLTITGLTVWASVTGFDPSKIISAITNPLADVAKRFIGGIEAVGKSLTAPIGSALGTVMIIIGVVVAIVILVVGIVFGVKAAKKKLG